MKTLLIVLNCVLCTAWNVRIRADSPGTEQQTSRRDEERRKAREEANAIGATIVREFGGQAFWCGQLHDQASIYADFTSLKIDDSMLERLGKFERIGSLTFNGAPITDAGLERLKGLTQLQWLRLRRSKITDAGLKHLEGLGELTTLNLSSTNISDVGIEHLKRLTKLRFLDLRETRVSDAGLENLKDMPQLEDVRVSDSKVTKEGLERFESGTLSKVQALIVAHRGRTTTDDEQPNKPIIGLDLSYTELKDLGLAYIKAMAELRSLNLRHTKVTDAGLENLKSLANLKSLDLRDTEVSDEAVKKLQQSLPECKIVH
jgi:internalin A